MIKRILTLFLALTLVSIPVRAAETDSDQVYCFSAEDFSPEEPLVGICITGLPESRTGTVFLGSRVLQPGDILTADQVSQMTFSPVRTEFDGTAQVTYLPIYDGRVAPSATMTIAIRGKEDKAPVAEDFSLETYKNLPLEGVFKAHDPEGEKLTFTVMRQPRRGTLELGADGAFTYTPKKNKVGVDSFTYTATDPAGKVSREATVTIQILKPTDDKRYTDTAQFEAEWLRHTGLFQGETVSGQLCFHPEKTVSRGEFLAMVMQLLEVPLGDAETLNENAPQWLQPYLAAAMRSGLMTNFPNEALASPISGKEAATILQNALDLSAQLPEGEDTPTFGEAALATMNQNGVNIPDSDSLTRAEAAQLLYEVSQIAATAPGLMVFRAQ